MVGDRLDTGMETAWLAPETLPLQLRACGGGEVRERSRSRPREHSNFAGGDVNSDVGDAGTSASSRMIASTTPTTGGRALTTSGVSVSVTTSIASASSGVSTSCPSAVGGEDGKGLAVRSSVKSWPWMSSTSTTSSTTSMNVVEMDDGDEVEMRHQQSVTSTLGS